MTGTQVTDPTSGFRMTNTLRSAYYMTKVLLALFVGLFRARPAVERGERAAVSAVPSL